MTEARAFCHDDETLTDLQVGNLKVLQKKQGFRFAIDAVLLAHFAPLKPSWRVCDLASGSGVIPLLLTTRSHDLAIDAVELQPSLAEMAQRSLLLNALENIRVHQADLRTLPPSWQGAYQLVTCNPPCFPLGAGKLSPLPEIALARHELACTLADVVTCAARLLKSGGHFCLIHRPERLSELLLLCQGAHLAPRRLRLVHPEARANANLLLLDAVKDARPDLRVEAPLIIYSAPGQYSPEMRSLYGGCLLYTSRCV